MPRGLERLWLRIWPRHLRRLPLPDFLGIGAQKSGTTWLAENLRAHPAVFIPARKELHFFDRRFHRSLRSYARHFEPAAGRCRGEITPAYALLPPPRIRTLHRLLPDLRLLLLLRNPIERDWSQAVMELAEQRGRPAQSVTTDEYLAFLARPDTRARSDYEAVLDRWLSVFPRERLWIDYFDRVRSEPEAVVAGALRHLGIEPPASWDTYPLRRVVVPRSGTKARDFWAEAISRSRAAPCPPAVQRVLEERYAAQLERLAKKLGDPVASWLPQ